jgi:outer membrane protein insertion porin family
MFRKARLLSAGAAIAILLALLGAHAPSVRALVLRQAVEAARASYGIDLHAESLSYNLLTLSAELRGLRLAAVGTPAQPFAATDRLAVSFGLRTLIGNVSLQQVSITSPRIDVRRQGDGTDNLPRGTSDRSNTATFALPPILVEDLDISFQQPSASAGIRGATLHLTSDESGRLTATNRAQRGLTMTAGDRTIAVDAAAGTFDLEGRRLDVRELTASRPGAVLHGSGGIAFGSDSSTVDITVNCSSDIESWWTDSTNDARPVGRVDAIVRVTGSLSEPAIAFETLSPSLAWSGMQATAFGAAGSYTDGQLSLKSITLGIAGGTAEAHGTIVLDGRRGVSRVEARWAGIDARQIPGVSSLDGRISKSGTAVVEWHADGASVPPRVNVTATTGVVASGKTVPIVVRASGQGERWHVEASPRDTSALDLTATANIRLDSRRWQASTIGGRVVVRTTSLPAAIRQAHDFGIGLSVDPSTAAGTIDVDATIDGTLGDVRSTGRVIGRAVTLAGLPLLDVDASFGVDAARKTSTGTFHVLAHGLESATFTSRSDLTLGGSFIAAGTWSGPLSEPVVDATVTGRNLTIRREGSPTVTAVGAFDGVLTGPATNLGGEGSLTITSMNIDGRGIGDIAADLTLASGTVRVQARAPGLKTTIDGSLDLMNPNTFEGRGTIADYDIDALLGITGMAARDAGAVSGRVSGSIAFKGDLRNLPATMITLDVAPIDATVFGVPIAMSRGLRASMNGGSIQVDLAMMIGGLGVRLGGALATDRSAGKLALDVDGDLGPLAPWLIRFSGHDDLAAAGRITGRLETEASPAGFTASGTINATLSELSKGNRVLANDVSASIVLAGQRAEVREATGAVLGGQLAATADVPLGWLNQWLPSGWQVAQRRAEAPATLEGRASVDVPSLLDVVGRPPMEALGGSVDLSAKLSASRPDVTTIVGDFRLERAEASLKDLKFAQSDVTRFRLSDGALAIETLDWRGPGSSVIGRGRVGLIPGVETDLRLDVATELGIVGAFLAGRATGRLEGSVELHGQSSAVRITSDVTLRDASWLIPGQRILFAGWSGQVRLADQALSVTNLGGTVNGGTVRIDGQLPFEAGVAGGGLTIVANDILVDVPRGLHSQLAADLVWQRAEPAPRLRGTVGITSNRYTEPVTRILQLVNSMSSATSGSESTLPSWLARTALDISLAVTDPILIANSAGNVELIPDLRLGGTIDSPALSGRVDVVDGGRITIGGRTYRLRDSQVRFAPADGLLPTLDAIGDTRIGDYDVTIRINGTPDRIETTFSSVPPLGERDLQSLIVTGQAGEQTTQSRQSDDNFAAAAAATDILGFAGQFVGLDSVRIGAADLDLVSKDVSTAQHLTVMKSLGSSFDLIFSDNLEDGSVTWVLVWKPTTVNEIRASSVEDGTRTLEFRRSYVFGPGTPSGTRTGRRTGSTQPRPTVDIVRITGTPGFSDAELSRRLELAGGDRFDVRQWIGDRRQLERFYLGRGYYRVRIAPTRRETADRATVSLTYDIERGPRTIIETDGDPLPGEVMDAMYEAWRALPIADVVRPEFERIAREGLARRGYYRPTVQTLFSPETADLARVTIQVARGLQTKRLIVAWRGNRAVSSGELDALVAPQREESNVWLDSTAVALHVRQLYASRGYLLAQVTIGEPDFQDAVAMLPFAIDEGELSRLADVELEGVDPARLTGATEAVGLLIGAPFVASAPVEATRRLKAFYTGLGYRRAAVTHTLTTAKNGSVSIAWRVTEGPLYLVKDVDVVGAETTSDGLVRKAIALKPGDAMSQSAIEATSRNLYDIGTFRRVDFDFGDSALNPGESGEQPRTLTINAEEPQRFQLKYGVQFSFDRSTGKGGGTAFGGSAELRDRNFIGRAVQGSAGVHWDPDLQTIALLLSSPRVFGKRIRTNVYLRDRREQDILDETTSLEGATLDDRRREATFEQRWRPASVFELVWGYNFSFRRFLLDRDDQHLDTGGLLAGPVFSVIFDKRDSPFDARRGSFHSSSFQFGVGSSGSDLSYVRYLLRQSYYQPLGKFTAAGSVRFGTIHPYSGTAPVSIIDLLFNAGGTSTVRGYPEDSLSAINIAGFALGGTDLLIMNGELRFPISRLFEGAAFVDAGNTFASTADLKLDSLALGAGLGLRVRTPLAPLRLDFGYPFTDAFGHHGLRFHFSIGQMF